MIPLESIKRYLFVNTLIQYLSDFHLGIITDLSVASSIAVGAISAIALAFSIHFSREQAKASQQQIEQMKIQNRALEAQVEELKKQTKELMKKPKIELEKDLHALTEFPPPVDIRGAAKFIRIKATNKGETTAKECIAKAEIKNRNPELGGVLLHWVRYREHIFVDIKDQYRPIDIATNDSEIADLIVLLRDDIHNQIAVALRTFLSPLYSSYPNDGRLFLRVNDEIHVRVFCSNSEQSNELIITYKNQFNFNTINKDNIGQYFEIVQKEEE